MLNRFCCHSCHSCHSDGFFALYLSFGRMSVGLYSVPVTHLSQLQERITPMNPIAVLFGQRCSLSP